MAPFVVSFRPPADNEVTKQSLLLFFALLFPLRLRMNENINFERNHRLIRKKPSES